MWKKVWVPEGIGDPYLSGHNQIAFLTDSILPFQRNSEKSKMPSSELDIFPCHLNSQNFIQEWRNGWEILTALPVLASLFHFKQEQPAFCQYCDEEICNS